MSDFSSQLFSYLPAERLKTFSCGHVIPQKNLQTLVLTQGPRKTDLLWKFDKQGNKEMVRPLLVLAERNGFPFIALMASVSNVPVRLRSSAKCC